MLHRLHRLSYPTEKDFFRKLIRRFSGALTCIESDSELIARACILPDLEWEETKTYSEGVSSTLTKSLKSVVTVGGLRASDLTGVFGIFKGITERASRDSATPAISLEDLAKWASEQSALIANLEITSQEKYECARRVLYLGGSTADLPIALTSSGWKSDQRLSEWASSIQQIVLVDHRRLRQWEEKFGEVELLDNVLVTDTSHGDFCQLKFSGSIRRWPQSRFPDFPELLNIYKSTLASAVVSTLARAWSASADEILRTSGRDALRLCEREIARSQKISLRDRSYSLRRPD